MIENDFISQAKSHRYQAWNNQLGQSILSGEQSLASLAAIALDNKLALNMFRDNKSCLKIKLMVFCLNKL